MARPDAKHVSALLEDLRSRKPDAPERLIAAVYPELRAIAGRYLRAERQDHTLQPTALVHETYARLFGPTRVDWKSRAHFFAAIATEMRRILVDYARARNAQKRPGNRVMVSLELASDQRAVRIDEDLVALNEALNRLATLDPRAARIVELRFFTGLDERETAEALAISVATVKRDWQFAKTWLFDALRSLQDDVSTTKGEA
jgi:RNA polymerase sigma factor (TIGR02999 family)